VLVVVSVQQSTRQVDREDGATQKRQEEKAGGKLLPAFGESRQRWKFITFNRDSIV